MTALNVSSIGVRRDEPMLTWFRRVMGVGIVANILVALVGVMSPATVTDLLHLEPAQPLVWPRFAAFLLILLSVFYLPAATDPGHYRFNAIFAVICRFGGVVFFLLIGGNYLVFGLFDLVFGLPQAILLWLATRRDGSAAGTGR